MEWLSCNCPNWRKPY